MLGNSRLASWALTVAVSMMAAPSVAAAPLTPVQSRLIALVTYIQVARDHCRYGIDVDLLRKTAVDIGVTFQTPEQAKARDEGFADAERRFVGVRRAVECAYALERFGPHGSEMPGLLERLPAE